MQDFFGRVDSSQCIFSNRRGDLPIWGSLLLLAGGRRHRFLLKYEHGSHAFGVNSPVAGRMPPDYCGTTLVPRKSMATHGGRG